MRTLCGDEINPNRTKPTERAEYFCILLDEAEKDQTSSRHKSGLQGGPALRPHLKEKAWLTWRHSELRRREPQRAERSEFASGGYSSRLPPAGCSVRKPDPPVSLPTTPAKLNWEGHCGRFCFHLCSRYGPRSYLRRPQIVSSPKKDGCWRRWIIFKIMSKIILSPMAYLGLEPGTHFCGWTVART